MASKVKKAFRTKPGKIKPIKAKKIKKKKVSQYTIITNIIAETIQANSDGEFDLPSSLVRYIDKSHPRFKYGLHRESYVPAGKSVPYYSSDDPRGMQICRFFAGVVSGALGEGIPVKNHKFSPPLCNDCDN